MATRFYFSLVALMVGIAAQAVFSFSHATLLWLLLLAFVAAVTWRRGTVGAYEGWLLASLMLAFFVVGAWRFAMHDATFGQSALAGQIGQSITLTGVVIKEPEQRESSLHLYVQSGADTILVTTDRYTFVAYGDELSVSGVLRQPESFTTDLGRTFNYPEYLKVRNVEYTIVFAEVEVIGSGQGNRLIATLLGFKQRFVATLNATLPEPASGLAAGVLLGVKQALGEELERVFRETGIIHIVVLSGYNIMLVISFMTFVLGSFFSRKVTAVVSIFAIASFALMVGLSATVLRACLMAGILLMAQVAHRRYLALRALLFVGVMMLIMNPYLLLYDIGFQLSFMATLGLILFAPYVERVSSAIPTRLSLRQLFAATVSTQIAVLPLLMLHIGEVSLVGVIVNLLVLPVVPFAMFFSFVLGLAGLIVPGIVPMVSFLAYACLAYIIQIAHFFATLPFAAAVVPPFGLLALGLSYGLMAGLYTYVVNRYPLSESSRDGTTDDNAEEVSLAGWTIEEDREPDMSSSNTGTKAATAPGATAADTTPIFFR